MSGIAKPPVLSASHAPAMGPSVCPMPKLVVRAAISRVGFSGASRRASRITSITTGIATPPISTLPSAKPAMLGQPTHSRIPPAISAKQPARGVRFPSRPGNSGTRSTPTAAAPPNSGQNHSRKPGICRCSPAINGRNVAGMM